MCTARHRSLVRTRLKILRDQNDLIKRDKTGGRTKKYSVILISHLGPLFIEAFTNVSKEVSVAVKYSEQARTATTHAHMVLFFVLFCERLELGGSSISLMALRRLITGKRRQLV